MAGMWRGVGFAWSSPFDWPKAGDLCVVPPFCSWMLQNGVGDGRLFLVDVGCRGGLPPEVAAWPGEVIGVGADPDSAEISRLARASRWPGMSWVSAWIESHDGGDALPGGMSRAEWRSWNNRTWRRTSSCVAQTVEASSAPPGDPGQQAEPAPRRTLDDIARPLSRVDLVKVDTDGHDLDVLRSGQAVLRNALAVHVEVQFQGDAHPRANTFGNVDLLLRQAGFELFDLNVHRHSRAVLPSRFLGSGGAPTERGQVVWGDALYARDWVSTSSAATPRVWELAAILELFGLPDCAMELLDAGGHLQGRPDGRRALGGNWWPDGGDAARHLLQTSPSKLLAVPDASGANRSLRRSIRARLERVGEVARHMLSV